MSYAKLFSCKTLSNTIYVFMWNESQVSRKMSKHENVKKDNQFYDKRLKFM